MEEMLSFSLTYGDELWHVVLYQWLIDNALTDRLLEVRFLLSFAGKEKHQRERERERERERRLKCPTSQTFPLSLFSKIIPNILCSF